MITLERERRYRTWEWDGIESLFRGFGRPAGRTWVAPWGSWRVRIEICLEAMNELRAALRAILSGAEVPGPEAGRRSTTSSEAPSIGDVRPSARGPPGLVARPDVINTTR